MKAIRIVLRLFVAMAVAGFVFSFSVEATYRAKAKTVQLVRIDPNEHNPFGPVTEDIGEPIAVLIDDPGAIMKNKTATGVPKLDVGYLEKREIPLLSLDSLLSLIKTARIGCVAAIALAIAGFILLGRMKAMPPSSG